MSYDINLNQDGHTVEVERHEDGGTFQLGGSTEARLNVTTNYAAVAQLVGFDFRDSLHSKRAGDTIESLRDVVAKLGTKRWHDYWAPTPGNAEHAASILLKWAQQHPDAVREVEA